MMHGAHSLPPKLLTATPSGLWACCLNCWHLQDMLLDLETAKVELDLARGRADKAEAAANALRVQLAATQQRGMALEAQLQSTQAK